MARKVKSKDQIKTILVLVEGKTEQIYFSQLRGYEYLVGLNLQPKLAKQSNPYHILKSALAAKEEDVYDFIWCVFDKDILHKTKPKDFDQLYAKAIRKNINFAESLPCFEVWFLLHFVLPKRFYTNAKSVENELCEHLKGYCKDTKWLQESKIYNILKEHQSTAIENSKVLSKNNRQNHNPKATFSNIYKLVESILNQKN